MINIKTLYLFLLTVLVCSTSLLHAAVSKQAHIDSLVAILPKLTEADKVNALLDISFKYRYISPEKCISFGNDALKLAKQHKLQKQTAAAYANVAFGYYRAANYALSLTNNFEALRIYESLNDTNATSPVYLNIGNVHRRQRNFKKAFSYYSKSLEVAKKSDDANDIGLAYASMASSFQETSAHDSAVAYGNKALDIFKRTNNYEHAANVMMTIGNVFLSKREYGKAFKYYHDILKTPNNGDIDYVFASTYGNIGTSYILIARSEDFKYPVPEADNTDGFIKQSKNDNIIAAIDNLQKGIDIAMHVNDIQAAMEFEYYIHYAYTLKGDFEKALDRYIQYDKLKDSVFSIDNVVTLTQADAKREEELKQKQIALNNLLKKKKQEEQLFFTIGIIALLIGSGIVLRYYLKAKRTNHLLEDEKRKTDALNEKQSDLLVQKDVLMKEIHHRVKNNLQIISTLLDLQLTNVNDDVAKSAMTESKTRVKSISLIHQQLYQNENLTVIEFSNFAKDLMYQVTSALKSDGQNITLNNGIPEILLDIDTAVPLGLIVNELMTNSYKYAFNNADTGYINIAINKLADHFELTYKDSGDGLPDGIKTNNKSLGMRVINSLSKQLGGAFIYNTELKEFRITFLDLEGRKAID